LTLYKKWWRCGKKPVAVLVYVHGYALHALFGNFAAVAERLNQSGIDVLAISLRGYGKSQGPRGFIADFREHFDDAEAAVMEARQNSPPQTPIFLFGYSWVEAPLFFLSLVVLM